MGRILNLPEDILGTIMILLVTSGDGATDLARLSATCNLFRSLARLPYILKVVNFKNIPMDDYGAHHDRNDLLVQCARAQNIDAESMLGKALMHNDSWFWDMMMEYDIPLLDEEPPIPGLLFHPNLVRSFICHASGEEIAPMRIPFFSYFISFLGHALARSSGILIAATNLCMFEIDRNIIPNDGKVYRPQYAFSEGHRPYMCGVQVVPPSGPTYREILLAIFDEMFL